MPLPAIGYNGSIPATGNNPSSDQPTMQANAAAVETILAVDHFSFNTANGGAHQQITMFNALSPPALNGDIEIYAGQGSSSAFVPFLRNLAQSSQPLISGHLGITGSLGGNNFSSIYGGLILQWGSFDPNVSINVTFPLPFPTALINIQLTGSASNNSTFRAGVSTGSLSKNGFTFEGTVDSHWTPIYWFAVGI